MAEAKRDDNFVTTLLAVSSVDGVTPVTLYANPTTHRLLVDLAGGGSGDVVGPASSTDNAVARFDGITGKLLQNSLMTVDDAGAFVATDGSKVSGTEGGGFGYIVLAIENLSSGGRAELSLDTDEGAFAGFVTMAGSATTNKPRQFDIGTRVAGPIGFWTNDVERMTLSSTGVSLYPTVSDALALGSGTNMWSDLFLASGGVINWNAGDVVLTHSADRLTMTGGGLTVERAGTPAIMLNNSDLATVQALILDGDRATPSANDNVYMSMRLSDSAGNQDEFVRITATATSVTSTTEAGSLTIGVMTGGTLTNAIVLTPTALTPFANDGIALGSATVSYADLFLASGGVINWANGNATLTHSTGALTSNVPITATNFVPSASTVPTNGMYLPAANNLGWAINSAAELSLTASTLSPAASAGLTLGTGTLPWSNTFLATGAAINWANGNVTLTHGTGALTVAGATTVSLGTSATFTTGTIELGAASDTTLSRSAAGVLAVEGVVVPTISSTNTLTNKRIQPRTASSTSAATLTPDISTASTYFRTTQTVGLTINAPTGTPVIGETIIIYVDSAGAQTLTIDATYVAFGAAFPASTTAGKTFMMSCQYNGTNWKTLWANAI